MNRYLLLAITFVLLPLSAVAQTNSAVNDSFTVASDSSLIVSIEDLLSNDSIVSEDSTQFVLIDSPDNGTLTLNEDGSYMYEPNADFSGVDVFTYAIETLPMQSLVVDSTNSSIIVDMAIQVIASTARDTVEVPLVGSTYFHLAPYASPFSEINILEMELLVEDSLSLAFPFGNDLNIFAEADTNSFALSLVNPGPLATVRGEVFQQLDNTVNLSGAADLTGTGIFASLLPDSTLTFDAEDMVTLSGTVTSDIDNNLTLQSTFTIIDTLDLGVATVFLDVDGIVQAEGPLRVPEQSNVASVEITVQNISTGVSTESERIVAFALDQNYPNPFNPVTSIAFSLPDASYTTLKVFDVLGREVSVLIDGMVERGQHQALFEAGHLPSGIYFYRLESGSKTATRQLMLVK